MLVTHLLHPNGDIQFRILKALHRCGFRAGESRAEIERGMSRTLKRACTILRTRAELGDESALDPLRRALAFEEEQTREKLFLFLSFIYDAQGILGAETKLKWGGPADRALAIESLDVALAPEHKTFVLPLVDPQTTGEQKLEALRHSVEVPVKATEDRLHEIIRDEEGSWGHGWTQACALYAAGKMNLTNLAGLVEDALIRSAHPIRETAAWALYSLDRARFEEHRAALSRDDNPQVAQLVRRLTTS
jgi:hypothetical protein